MNSAPARPEAALQFTLRKSTRKTVTPGKDFRSIRRFTAVAERYPRSCKSVVNAPG